MSKLRVGIILGSTRPNRVGAAVAEWVLDQTTHRPATYEILDLAEHPLPHFDEAAPPVFGQYANAHTLEWAATIARYDGFVFITPEYNHSTSGVLKNAIDYLHAEWNNKAVAFVGYGSIGGARAIEHLRGITSGLQMAHVAQQLSFSLFTDFQEMRTFTPGPQHAPAADTMFAQLEAWTQALKPLRAA